MILWKKAHKSEGLRYAQHLLPWPERGERAPRHSLQAPTAAVGIPEQRPGSALPDTALRTNPTAACHTCLLKIWTNFWTNGLTEHHNSNLKNSILQTKKGHANKTNAFGWKTENILQLLEKSFFPQYVLNEKSVASLLVASHTSSHAAHTTSCTRLSPGEIQLQN